MPMRKISRKRKRLPKTIAGIRRLLKYGPLQQLRLFSSGAIAQATSNQVAYVQVFATASSTFNSFMDTYQPYMILPALNEGAPNTYSDTAVTAVQMNMAHDATGGGVRDAKIKFEGGQTSVLIRNNWDLPGTISLYLYRCIDHTSTTPITLLDEEMDDKYRDAVVKEQLLTDGFTLGKERIGKFWKQVGRTQTLTLNPSEQFEYKFKLSKGIYDDAFNDAHPFNHYKGLSMILMARIQGCVVHDATDTTKVGLGRVQFDFVARTFYNWRHIESLPQGALFQNQDTDTITTAIGAIPSVEKQDGDGDAKDDD